MPSTPRTALQIALRKRQEALESIALSRKRIATLEERIATLDAEIASYGGKKWDAKPRLPFRANGEMQRALFELLREKGSATAADLAAIMLERFGLDASDKATVYAMRQRAIQCFKRCERNGSVRHVGGIGKGGRFKVWRRA